MKTNVKRIVKRAAMISAAALLVIGTGTLSGCTTGKVLVKEQRNVVAMPPASLFDCPGLPPIPESYTQKDVADLLLKYYERGEICKENLEAVEEFLNEARKTLEET